MKDSEAMDKKAMTKQKFINQWLRHFASGLTKQQLDRCVNGQYIWHIFSFNLISNGLLQGDSARKAFNQVDKRNCISCDIFGAGVVTEGIPFGCDSAESIDEQFVELYVVSKDYSWTYIKTHEGNLCGPYFLRVEL